MRYLYQSKTQLNVFFCLEILKHLWFSLLFVMQLFSSDATIHFIFIFCHGNIKTLLSNVAYLTFSELPTGPKLAQILLHKNGSPQDLYIMTFEARRELIQFHTGLTLANWLYSIHILAGIPQSLNFPPNQLLVVFESDLWKMNTIRNYFIAKIQSYISQRRRKVWKSGGVGGASIHLIMLLDLLESS